MSFICSLPADIITKYPCPLHKALRQEVSPAFLSDSEEMAIISPTEHSFNLVQEQLFLSKKVPFSVPLMLFLRQRCCKASLHVGDFSGFPLRFSLRLYSSLVFSTAGVLPSVKTFLHVSHTFLRAALRFTVVVHSFQSLCHDQESGNK